MAADAGDRYLQPIAATAQNHSLHIRAAVAVQHDTSFTGKIWYIMYMNFPASLTIKRQ